MNRRHLLVTAIPAVLLGSTAHAVRQPEYLDERPLEVAEGPRGRLARHVAVKPPAPATAAFAAFRAKHGDWRASWDADTAIPTRLIGEGIDAPDPHRLVRELLAAHLDLLAPGASADDFVVVTDVVRAGVHTIWLQQRWRGLDVVGAGLRFTFKHGRLLAIGSTASPRIDAIAPGTSISATAASAKALAWIEDVHGANPTVLGSGGAVVLPVIRDRDDGARVLEHHVVVPVTVDQASPRAQWTVYVDAATGAPVARRQELMFGQGTVRYRVPARHPDGGYADYAAQFANHVVNSAAVTSTVAGLVTWSGTAASTVAPGLAGTYVRITNARGARASTSLSLADGGDALWDLGADEHGDAQLTTFIHATIAKRYALDNLDADLPWLHGSMEAVVNEGGGEEVCNAYSNLDDIHFLVAGSIGGINGWICGNTGRLADVVYHEFGHSIHFQSRTSGGWDSALSEGVSDYYAATITNDPAMGVGFFSNMAAEPLRHIDPAGSEYRWPEGQHADPHITGLIIAGALWDLRKALITELGEAPGIALADDVFYGIISRADDIPSSYHEALVTDDDDGNLANGTPHKCTIDRTFGAHGLGDAALDYGRVAPPSVDGLTLTLAQLAPESGGCAAPQIASAQVTWRIRGDASTTGTVAFEAGADTFVASIPAQADGTVVEYQIDATLDDGQIQKLPINPADRWYQLYVGPVTPLVCFDFEEQNPTTEGGWDLNGFEWGEPSPPPGGDDPAAAFSGARVIGIDLGDSGDGNYEDERTYRATMPQLDVGDFTTVRLQYRRWLNVEDGQFDDAAVLADNARLWVNSTTFNNPIAHRDGEWRFHDIDLSPLAQDGSVQVAFELTADDRNSLGGWNLDDVCVVVPGIVDLPEPECGEPGAEPCEPPDMPGEPGGCCSTGDDDATGPLLLGLFVALIGWRRRKIADGAAVP